MATENDLKRQGLWDYERDQPARRNMPAEISGATVDDNQLRFLSNLAKASQAAGRGVTQVENLHLLEIIRLALVGLHGINAAREIHSTAVAATGNSEVVKYPDPPYQLLGDSGQIYCPMCSGEGMVYPPSERAREPKPCEHES